MDKLIKGFLVLVVIAVFVEYWYIIIPILLLFAFILYRKEYNNSILSRNYDDLNGYEFEQYCAKVLRSNNFTNVRVTKTSGDFGIDILASKDGWNYAIQCKKYSSKVGNHAVQEAYSGRDFYGADIAVVLTNNYFTPAAIEAAGSLDVELWNRDILNKMVRHVSKTKSKSEDKCTYCDETPSLPETKDFCYVTDRDYEDPASEDIRSNNSLADTFADEKEDLPMYDVEKGIYPSGEYLVGEDLPVGKYLLKQRENSTNGEIHIYKDYQTYLKNPDNELIFKLFKGDYHLSLRTEGNLLVVENADIQKI